MRRAVSLAMVGLGVFALTLAVLLPTVVYNKLAKVPLAQESVTRLEGTASHALVAEKGEEPTIRRDIQVAVTARTKAVFSAPEMESGSDYAVWLQAVKVTDKADGKIITANQRQVCFNRRTMQGYGPRTDDQAPRECDKRSSFVVSMVESADGTEYERKLNYRPQPGINFKYPFDVEKQTYDVYQPSVHKAVQAEFVETTTVDGLTVYKFVQRIPTTKTGTETVPGSLLGVNKDTVTAKRTYEGTVTQWVEPTSGLIVKQRTVQHQELVAPDNPSKTATIFDGRVSYTAETVASKLDQARSIKDKLQLLSTTGPFVLAPIGIILLIVGVVLLVLARRRDQDRQAFDPDTYPRHRVLGV